jgi:hypothetical protein
MMKIHQYDEAANFLMMVADQEKNLKETCQITSSEALNLMQPLHALIDEEIKQRTYHITRELEVECVSSCHCGLYSDLTVDEVAKNRLFKKAQGMSKKDLLLCAEKTAQWFCSSKLFENLKSEVGAISSEEPNGL